MELVEAVILLLVGMVPGIWATFADVYVHGASAFSSHVSIWLLLVMMLATNARYRRQAGIGAAALSLGFIEAYYLSSSFTFAGMSRSTVIPLALLAVVGAVVANVVWAAKRERGALGLALKALVVVGTLVACVATHDAVSLTDGVCVAIIVYMLVIMRPHKVALEQRRARAEVERHESKAVQAGELVGASGGQSLASEQGLQPSAPAEAERERGHRRSSSAEGRRNSSRGSSRRVRRSAPAAKKAPNSGRASERRGGSPTPSGQRPSQPAGVERDVAPAPSAKGVSEQKRGTSSGAAARTTGDKERRSTSSRNRAQRPTRRTGGAVPEANRIRNSVSDRPRQGSPRQHRSGSSARRVRRR